MEKLNIAVVGSGISGLAAAWLLSKKHNVTLLEADAKPGGHANTLNVDTPDGVIPVDTGFIVYNEKNYPNLTALFDLLDVSSQETAMGFALSINGGAYEYCGDSVAGYFGQRRNIVNYKHWKLLREIGRFFRTAQSRISEFPESISLGEFLSNDRYSQAFIENHIVPMGAAIWSTPMKEMRGFPAKGFIDFYANHGMLQYDGRPIWRTVTGGSKNYVAKIIADGAFEVRCDTPIERIVRRAGKVFVSDKSGLIESYDHVVIATHADQALKLLGDADSIERSFLGSFSYQKNRAVLHRDTRWMPKRRSLWSSWNYLKTGHGFEADLCLTYWMNKLQKLKTNTNLFVTLNPTSEINPKAVDAIIDYDHPIFSAEAMQAQKGLWSVQGRQQTWFCGSYFGYGFHEDGLQSGLAVAEQLGNVKRPWQVENQSGRISLQSEAFPEAAE